ncbi:IS66 family transposase, partial [Bifidobacterium longum]|uniref:IS66 family transposase n=1 Tax=Bifidobacterium longum TaxID=216816 RepID=UPI0022AFACED
SFATPSLLAWIVNGKYVMSLPLYRIETDLKACGATISRQDMACLCSISCCGFSHDDFSGLGRACRPRNGLNWMVLVSPPERTGK